MKLIHQLDSMDCGAASLAMIVAHYGGSPNMDQIRQLCQLNKLGVSLLAISRSAEQLGFKTVGGRITAENLVTQHVLPCILHWDQEHFVVLHRVKRRRNGEHTFYVADPGKGKLAYSADEFYQHWVCGQSYGRDVGIALLLEPQSAFFETKGQDHRPKTRQKAAFLWGYMRRYKRFWAQLLLGLLAGTGVQLLFPFFTQAIVDVGVGSRDIGFVWLVLLAQAMLLVSRTAIEFIRSKILLHISTRINISLISNFFIKLMRLPMRFFDTKLMGDLLQRIEDHRRVENFLTANSLTLIFSLFSFVIFGAVLAYYNMLIFAIFTIGTALYALWIIAFLKKRRELDQLYFEAAGRNRNVTYQLINGMQEIKLQGCEQRKRWEWEDMQADLFGINLRSLNLGQIQQAGGVAINELKNILTTVLAATAVINGHMTLGMMLAVQYIIGQLNAPVEQLIGFIYSWQDVSLSLERMNEIHNEADEEDSTRTATTLSASPTAKDIDIQHISFKYDTFREPFVLHDISLHIPNNRVTAIVGASGSGKTTLLKLLLGYYEPQQGQILVDGQPLSQRNLAVWRAQCGVVMQDGYLFSDTIARNIAISDDQPDLDRIRHAARVACIADYIESLPLAYNTQVGQDGQGLSQGQRQRLLIARTVYKNPDFVLFDEATNALDANNERAIVENLQEFYRGKTVVVVAHRLSTVRNADQIVVLDGGRVVEQGTHDQLTALRGRYFNLVRNQLELGN